MITINLSPNKYNPNYEDWLAKNVGPRLHYLHNSIGGQGWVFKKTQSTPDGMSYEVEWTLTLEDDKIASWFLLMFPQ
mgnify:CR=1 FL=1